VDRQHDDDAEDADSQRVGVGRARLGALKELTHATETQQPVETDERGRRTEPRVQSVLVPSQAYRASVGRRLTASMRNVQVRM